jgi:hypothetical protein
MSFPQFSRFPPEIRCAVWELLVPAPRLISLYTVRGEVVFTNSSNNSTRRRREFKHVYTSKTAVPVLLHACRESRRIGLKYYELQFDTHPRPSAESLTALARRGDVLTGLPFETPAPIYVDFARDVMFLTDDVQAAAMYDPWPIMARRYPSVASGRDRNPAPLLTAVSRPSRSSMPPNSSSDSTPTSSSRDFTNLPAISTGLFENNVLIAAVPFHIFSRMRYLAMSRSLWHGSARFADMNRHLKSEDGIKGLIILEASPIIDPAYFHNRLNRVVLSHVSDAMKPRVKLLFGKLNFESHMREDGGARIWAAKSSSDMYALSANALRH